MEEIWKDIEGYEGLYQVSNLGRVKSLERYKENHTKLQKIREKIKRLRIHTAGYLVADLYKENESKTFFVHRLVAQAFISNENNLPQVNHIDGNKENNRVENLEWCTNQENQKHAYKIGLHKTRNMEKSILAMTKVTSKKVKCLETGIIYNSIAEAGRYYNISSNLISKVCKGKRKSAGKDVKGNPLHWEYI